MQQKIKYCLKYNNNKTEIIIRVDEIPTGQHTHNTASSTILLFY